MDTWVSVDVTRNKNKLLMSPLLRDVLRILHRYSMTIISSNFLKIQKYPNILIIKDTMIIFSNST